METFLAPTGQEAGADNSPIEVDEQADPEELGQELTDEQLERLERGESLGEDDGDNFLDRVEDVG